MVERSFDTLALSPPQPIAIIGIGCRFPGGINSPETFWQLLLNETDVITEIPAERVRTIYDDFPGTLEQVSTRRGGFLANVDQFDAPFFGISPREAERMDPQQRLLLEVSWEALEDAGQVASKLVGSKTGVFVGLCFNDYEAHMFADLASLDFHMTTGSGRYSTSGRISYCLGLQGPSMTIDTACSSSLVAVHLGCQSLWHGESSLVLAGGANVILRPHISLAYSRSGMIAADGLCKFGDAQADGYVRSEGAGIVVLKRLSQAMEDGDPIYAVIRGSGVNNDGHSSGYLATPGIHTQEILLHQVYQNARIWPNQVHYIEAHGSGTKVGDPIELGALGAFLAINRPEDTPCFVGSVKTNLGHTEGAAGVAGLIKTALILKHHTIPASLHFQEPNSMIPWQKLRLKIPTQLTALPAGEGVGIAGVNSFGITGTNAHVILSEAPPVLLTKREDSGIAQVNLLPISARTITALESLIQSYQQFLITKEVPSIPDICYTASCHRSHDIERLAVVASNHQELLQQLSSLAAGEVHTRKPIDPSKPNLPPKVVFVFPGQGSQWVGMGRELIKQEPVFRSTLEQCEKNMQPFVDWSLLEQLTLDATSPVYRLDEIDVIQPTLLAIEIALATLWRSWGIEPDAVIGHSMGEAGAAYVAGALSLEDVLRVICQRSKLLRQVAGKGAMAVVELSLNEAQEAIRGYEDELCVAVSNSHRMTVLAGEPVTLNTLVAKLQDQGVYCRPVKVDVASHSPQMDLLKSDLLAVLEGLRPQAATIPIYSTAIGEVIDGAELEAPYWVKNLRQPVLFSQMVQRLVTDNHYVFIEMSPHPILLSAIQQELQYLGQHGNLIPSLRRSEPEQKTILESLGTLYVLGYSIQWERLYPNVGSYVKLPLYPWQRESYWFSSGVKGGQISVRHEKARLLSRHVLTVAGTHLWEGEISTGLFPYLSDHRVQGTAVLPAAVYIDMVLTAVNEVFGPGSYTLKNVAFQEALTITEEKTRTLQLIIAPNLSGEFTFQFFSHPTENADTQTWTLHTIGEIHSSAYDHLSALPVIVPISFNEPSFNELSGAEHYHLMHKHGLEYGPGFQGVTHIWNRVQTGEVIGELQLPKIVSETVPPHFLHPSLLDASFQLLVNSLETSEATKVYLPVSLTSLTVYQQPNTRQKLWGYASRRLEKGAFIGDIFITDEARNLLVAVQGLGLQQMAYDVRAKIRNWLYTIQWQPAPLAERSTILPKQPGIWLIFIDSEGTGAKLVSRLRQSGETCVIVYPGASYFQNETGEYQLNPIHPEEFQRLLTDVSEKSKGVCQGILYLWGLTDSSSAVTDLTSLEAAQELGCLSVLHLIQALNTVQFSFWPRLWLITRGTQAVSMSEELNSIAQTPLWGLGGVIVNEHPELCCTRIDLNPYGNEQEDLALFAELWSSVAEEQIAWRGDGRYAARLVHHLFQPPADTASEITKVSNPGEVYHLEISHPGTLDNLRLREAVRQQPGDSQIEIEIYATGLNFIDVMKAMGIYPGLDAEAPVALGAECAGRITAIGEGVNDFRVGDEVIAITPNFETTGFFRTHVTIPFQFAIPKPAYWTFEEASAVPIVFLTAYYAMCHLGRLSKGERVLIHSAAGGVGLAAVQLAQLMEAEVFATAGSAEKRTYLEKLGIQHVMDSHALTFAAEIMTRTNGKGVDMVLNSLSGEALHKSLTVLGTHGRFLEIGKRDIYQNNWLGMAPFQKGLSFFAIDMARIIKERPSFVMSLLQEIVQLFSEEKLHTLPVKIFPMGEVKEAFHYMGQAKHIGKIALSLQNQNVTLTDSKTKAVKIYPDKTYLITGGLGGLGLITARWLVQQGARHLVLVSRSGKSEEGQHLIPKMKAEGVQVILAQADVARPNEMAEVLAQIDQTLPPLRGIIHAAGILEDALLSRLTSEQFKRVMAPKLQGAWNLHTLTQKISLDFFILFSSAATLLGSPGQGNYVAANAFLDALAHYRRARGLPGLSINWGPWTEKGLAVAQSNRGERLASQGLDSITPEQGVASLAWLMEENVTQMGVMPFDLPQWVQFVPGASPSSFLQELAAKETSQNSLTRGNNNVHDLLSATILTEERHTLLESHLREQVGQVLRLAPSSIPTDRSFKNLGVDSLMALELKYRLETSLKLPLSTTLIFNYPTITALTQYLTEKLSPQKETQLKESDSHQTTSVPPSDQADNLDSLSHEELELLLAEELAAIDSLLKDI